jgi:chemotaxis protein MotB
MKKFLILVACSSLFLTSCVSNKEHAALEAKQKTTQDLLNTATVKLNDCLSDRSGLSAENNALKNQVTSLNASNGDLINQIGDFTDLTIKGASNLEKSLESMKQKDVTINKLRDAITRRDSVNLALVQSLKGVLGDMNDTDIEINVEKGVVFVSISDKLLFKSGSINVSGKAKEVLGKIAMVVNNKPDFEFLVEGHTDSKTISTDCIKDNWDLSVLRATTVVRILQDDFGVSPARMTAGGRSQYVPKSANETAEGRAKNRRTRIVILPKLDQFYTMIEDGLKDSAIN